jgi:HEAT repeat protein
MARDALATALVALALLGGCRSAPPALAPQALAAGLSDPDPETRRQAADGAWRAGLAAVPTVVDLAGSDEPTTAKAAVRALATIAHHAARPAADAERARLEAALLAELDRELAPSPRRAVLHALADAGGARAAAALAPRLAEAESAEDALFALERIGDPAAERVLVEALARGGTSVPRSALARALGAKTSLAAVEPLLALERDGSSAERRAARAALAAIGDPRAADPLRSAFGRGEAGAADDFLSYAAARAQAAKPEVQALYEELRRRASEPHVRVAALRGWARLAGASAFGELIEALADPAASVRAAAREALVAIPVSGESILRQIAPARAEVRSELCAVLVARREPAAGRALAEAIRGDSAEVRLAALRLAGGVDDPSLEPLLVRWAEHGEPGERAAAAASLLERARTLQGRGDSRRALELFRELVRIADGPRELAGAIEGLAALEGEAALGTLAALDDRSSLRDSLARARIAIASDLAGRDRGRARELLEEVCAGPASRTLRKVAARRLETLGGDPAAVARRRGCLTQWRVSEPFPDVPEGEQGQAQGRAELGEHPFGSDVAAHAARWRVVSSADPDGVVDLAALLDPDQDVVAYAYGELASPLAREAQLLVGSDDGVAIWINGARVHSHRVSRGLTPDEDRVPVTLREGTNSILVKVAQGGGDWGFCVRAAGADGRALE